MIKGNLGKKKFVYCYDNISEVCEKHGSYYGEYFACYPDDPEFIIIEKPAKFCGINDNDFGEEIWEIDGKKYTFRSYLGDRVIASMEELPKYSKELPGVILPVD